jgi:hypothetical protein
MPVLMPTRAPVAGVNTKDAVHIGERITEPFAVNLRDLGKDGVKFIWWYIARVKAGADKLEGTQTDSEDFESVFVDADAAVERLTFDPDRKIVQKAIDIVSKSLEAGYTL